MEVMLFMQAGFLIAHGNILGSIASFTIGLILAIIIGGLIEVRIKEKMKGGFKNGI